MHVIARRALDEFCLRHPDAAAPLTAWYWILRHRSFASPRDIEAVFATASVLGGGLVVFNIGSSRYRLVAHIRYDVGVVLIKRVLA